MLQKKYHYKLTPKKRAIKTSRARPKTRENKIPKALIIKFLNTKLFINFHKISNIKAIILTKFD